MKPNNIPEGFGLWDLHIHSAGISLCSQIPAERLPQLCRKEGLAGIVLTNHYKQPHVRGEFTAWRQRYVEEYETVARHGETLGVKVLFGVEVTLNEAPHNDYTVYGLSTADLLEADPLYLLTLPELSAFVHEKGALLYHAHPYRHTVPADPRYLDGVEINCHPLYRTCHEADVRSFAAKHGLRLSCGSDYHGDTYKPHCGVFLPDSINTETDLVTFLRSETPSLRIAPDPLPGQSVAPGEGDAERSAGF